MEFLSTVSSKAGQINYAACWTDWLKHCEDAGLDPAEPTEYQVWVDFVQSLLDAGTDPTLHISAIRNVYTSHDYDRKSIREFFDTLPKLVKAGLVTVPDEVANKEKKTRKKAVKEETSDGGDEQAAVSEEEDDYTDYRGEEVPSGIVASPYVALENYQPGVRLMAGSLPQVAPHKVLPGQVVRLPNKTYWLKAEGAWYGLRADGSLSGEVQIPNNISRLQTVAVVGFFEDNVLKNMADEMLRRMDFSETPQMANLKPLSRRGDTQVFLLELFSVLAGYNSYAEMIAAQKEALPQQPQFSFDVAVGHHLAESLVNFLGGESEE